MLRRAPTMAALVAFFAAVVSMVPAHAGPARATAAPELAATTTLIGSRNSTTPVTLNRPVAVDLDAFRKSVRTTGSGRAVGTVLVHQASKTYLGSLRLSYCEQTGCTDKDPLTVFPSRGERDAKGRLILPTGRYLIYLIADGRPARVTVRLPGRSGSSVLRPQWPAGPGVLRPKATREVDAGGYPFLYGGGITPTPSTQGFGLFAINADSRQWAGAAVGFCFYESGSPPEEVAFAPGCPTAESQTGTPDLVVNPVGYPLQRHYVSGTSWNSGPPAAFGGYFAAAAINESVRAVGFVLNFRDHS